MMSWSPSRTRSHGRRRHLHVRHRRRHRDVRTRVARHQPWAAAALIGGVFGVTAAARVARRRSCEPGDHTEAEAGGDTAVQAATTDDPSSAQGHAPVEATGGAAGAGDNGADLAREWEQGVAPSDS